MNYYNPYFNFYPTMNTATNTGLFSRLFGGRLTLSSIMSGTQRTLNFINQAIPVVKQVSPVVKNAKTMFKVMNEFKKTDTPKGSIRKEVNKDVNKQDIVETQTNDNGPTFFI